MSRMDELDLDAAADLIESLDPLAFQAAFAEVREHERVAMAPVTSESLMADEPDAELDGDGAAPDEVAQATPKWSPADTPELDDIDVNRRVEDHFETTKKLGSGAFAEVWLATSKKSKQAVALKIIDKEKSGKEVKLVNTEVKILRRVKHSNVIQMIDVFESKSHIYMALELATGGELFDRIVDKGSFSEEEARQVTHNMVDAIAYLHSMGIVHRDLKPENLLCVNEKDVTVKISDFGLSKLMNEEEAYLLKSTCGTPGYVAPEVLRQKGYDKSVDIWSCGVILYIMLCGFPPFYNENQQKLFSSILRGQYTFRSPWWDPISADAKDLVRRMMTVRPDQRITIDEIRKHPWYTKGQSEKPIENLATELVKSKSEAKFKAASIAATSMIGMIKIVNTMKAEDEKARQASMKKMDTELAEREHWAAMARMASQMYGAEMRGSKGSRHRRRSSGGRRRSSSGGERKRTAGRKQGGDSKRKSDTRGDSGQSSGRIGQNCRMQ